MLFSCFYTSLFTKDLSPLSFHAPPWCKRRTMFPHSKSSSGISYVLKPSVSAKRSCSGHQSGIWAIPPLKHLPSPFAMICFLYIFQTVCVFQKGQAQQFSTLCPSSLAGYLAQNRYSVISYWINGGRRKEGQSVSILGLAYILAPTFPLRAARKGNLFRNGRVSTKRTHVVGRLSHFAPKSSCPGRHVDQSSPSHSMDWEIQGERESSGQSPCWSSNRD